MTMGALIGTGKMNRLETVHRLVLRLYEIRRTVDGIEIGCSKEVEFERVVAALGLIRGADPLRYRRLHRDIPRILVQVLVLSRADYNADLQACELDTRYVLSDAGTTIDLASSIVHEATHARLENLGIEYLERRRPRIEGVCLRRELAFLTRLSGGERRRAEIERTLAEMPSLTEDSLHERYEEGAAESLAYLGMPRWLIRPVLAVCSPVRRMRRSFSRQR